MPNDCHDTEQQSDWVDLRVRLGRGLFAPLSWLRCCYCCLYGCASTGAVAVADAVAGLGAGEGAGYRGSAAMF